MKLARWGNSLALRIPAKLVEEMELKEGDEFRLKSFGSIAIHAHKELSRKEAMERIRAMQVPFPPDWKMTREEMNAR
jgi:antitoxin MazE